MQKLLGLLIIFIFVAVFNGYAQSSNEELVVDQASKESCLRQGGEWGKSPHGIVERCNAKTVDAGKICEDNEDCQGDCIADLTQEQQKMSFQEVLSNVDIKGKCSEFEFNLGCFVYLRQGKASWVCRD